MKGIHRVYFSDITTGHLVKFLVEVHLDKAGLLLKVTNLQGEEITGSFLGHERVKLQDAARRKARKTRMTRMTPTGTADIDKHVQAELNRNEKRLGIK